MDSGKKYFSGHASFTPDILDDSFKTKNKHILRYPRGSGFWLWKPYIINKTLSLVENGDIVFYIDSGNLIVNDPAPLYDICNQDEKGIVLFENRDGAPEGTIWKNYMWTKQDCFLSMNCNEDKYIYGDQVDGSYILLKKNDYTVDFFKEYLFWCEKDELITDMPSSAPNHPDFKDHRHDQSILSILAIKHNITKAREPSEWGNAFICKKYNYPQIFRHHRGLI